MCVSKAIISNSIIITVIICLYLQSSRSRPISAPNQHANIVDEIARTQQRLHADSQVRPNTNGDYNRQLGNQPMAGQQHQQITPYIPVPICKPGGSPTSDLSIIDINYFFIKILKWNASWFDEYGNL